jgi:hypothetical protein
MTKDKALRLALEALVLWDGRRRLRVIAAIKEALDVPETNFGNIAAQPAQEPHNFCPRCGKRLEGVLGRPQMHTCTPPLWGHI